MKYGVILARFQPIHNGHIALIKKASLENDKVLILIGSADKFNNRNPIPVSFRRELVEKSLEENNLLDKCILLELNDLTSETDNTIEWGFYLYANIVKNIKEDNFTIYYSDGFEIITTWFPGNILRNHISLSLLARSTVEKGISATKVRDCIVNGSDDLTSMVPTCVYNEKDAIKRFIEVTKLLF